MDVFWHSNQARWKLNNETYGYNLSILARMHNIRKNILRGFFSHQHCHIHHSRRFVHQCLGIHYGHVMCVLGCQRQFEQLLLRCHLPELVRHDHVAIRPVHHRSHTCGLLFAHATGRLLVLETLAPALSNPPWRHSNAGIIPARLACGLDCRHHRLADLHPVFNLVQRPLFAMGQRDLGHQHRWVNSHHLPFCWAMGDVAVLGHLQRHLVVLGALPWKRRFNHRGDVGI